MLTLIIFIYYKAPKYKIKEQKAAQYFNQHFFVLGKH